MFDKPAYIEWTYKRMKCIIAHFGHDSFMNKTVLDLGAGYGDCGAALMKLGARVTAVDVRQHHLDILKQKHLYITTICADLDKFWPFLNQKFDYVLSLGILCHVTNYEQILRKSCALTDNIVIESEICDSNDPNRVIQVDEHRSIQDWAFNGVGHKPSASNIENILANCGMSTKRFDDESLNSGNYKYNWIVSDTGSRKIGNRRLWIAKRDDNIIVPDIPASKPSHNLTVNSLAPVIRPKYQFNKSIINPTDRMRIAVCLSGYLRTFDSTHQSLHRNLPENAEIDYFIHTWDKLGAPLRGFDSNIANTPTVLALPRINQTFNLKGLKIDAKINFPVDPLMSRANSLQRRDIQGVLSMFYSIRESNQLKKDYETKHGFKYDIVLRARPDLFFTAPIPINNKIAGDRIYIPRGYDYEGINDQIAFGASSQIDVYSNIFDSIKQVLASGSPFNPEIFTKRHLELNNTLIERPQVNYCIKRTR